MRQTQYRLPLSVYLDVHRLASARYEQHESVYIWRINYDFARLQLDVAVVQQLGHLPQRELVRLERDQSYLRLGSGSHLDLGALRRLYLNLSILKELRLRVHQLGRPVQGQLQLLNHQVLRDPDLLRLRLLYLLRKLQLRHLRQRRLPARWLQRSELLRLLLARIVLSVCYRLQLLRLRLRGIPLSQLLFDWLLLLYLLICLLRRLLRLVHLHIALFYFLRRSTTHFK